MLKDFFPSGGHAVGTLEISPLAWMKLMYLTHAGDTEVGGFGITAYDDPNYITDIRLVKQICSSVTITFDDEDVANYMEQMVFDHKIKIQDCMRVWVHTHPGTSANPSGTDKKTFATAFDADGTTMLIIGRYGKETYAERRIHDNVTKKMDVFVDWDSWAVNIEDPAFSIDDEMADWITEYKKNVRKEEIELPLKVGDPSLYVSPFPDYSINDENVLIVLSSGQLARMIDGVITPIETDGGEYDTLIDHALETYKDEPQHAYIYENGRCFIDMEEVWFEVTEA